MSVGTKYRDALRNSLNRKNRNNLKNHNFTLLCNNCVGGVIYHELGERFNAPTINLFMYAEDYIKFLKHLDFYTKCEIREKKTDCNYPVGILGQDIEIHFMHYETFENAVSKWKERCLRINFDNLYVMMVQRDGASVEQIEEFLKLPFKNKVALTACDLPQHKNTYHIIGAEENESQLIDLCRYKCTISGRRWLDDFDYVSFLNNGI